MSSRHFLRMPNLQYFVSASILIVSMILAFTTGSSGYASSDVYDSGYGHGCNDADFR
jgi:uncharacterized membrane protein